MFESILLKTIARKAKQVHLYNTFDQCAESEIEGKYSITVIASLNLHMVNPPLSALHSVPPFTPISSLSLHLHSSGCARSARSPVTVSCKTDVLSFAFWRRREGAGKLERREGKGREGR